MARPPKPWYRRDGWYTDFGSRDRLLVRGPKNADTQLQAETELLRLRQEARLLGTHASGDTPIAVVVERFLEQYAGRPAYEDFSNELHYFMGERRSEATGAVGGKLLPQGTQQLPGGRFGFPCKTWSIRRITAELVERYLRRRKAAGLAGYHAFVALRTLLNWAKRKGYVPAHDLDRVDPSLHRKGRRRYLPADADVARAFRGAKGTFRDLLHVSMLTGIRPSELRTVTVDEFDREHRQWVLWRHKVVERTGLPKVVPLGSDELVALCVAAAGDRRGDEPLFRTEHGRAWTYNALRLRWKRLRDKLGLDGRFTLYSLRHWYLTMAVESGEDSAIVSELAGHADPATLDFYKKIRNPRLHQAARRVAACIARVGIGGPVTRSPAVPEAVVAAG